MITGVRGLCNGLGPALYGLIFYLFHVDLNDKKHIVAHSGSHAANETVHIEDASVIRVISTLSGVVLVRLLDSTFCRHYQVLRLFLDRFS